MHRECVREPLLGPGSSDLPLEDAAGGKTHFVLQNDHVTCYTRRNNVHQVSLTDVCPSL